MLTYHNPLQIAHQSLILIHNGVYNMSYLEEFVNSVNYLPGEVTRDLELLKLLDEKAKACTDEFSQMSSDYFSSLRKEQGIYIENPDLLSHIRSKHQCALSLSEEKIAISKQLLDMVDFHINKLRQDLDIYSREISTETEAAEEKINKKQKTEKNSSNLYDMDLMYMDNGEMPDSFDIQADENKSYCFCGKGSYGEMIECDGPNVMVR